MIHVRRAAVWLFVGPVAAWAVVRAGGWERSLLVQLFAFTPYVAVFAPLPVAIAVWTRRWAAAAVAVAAAVTLGAVVAPRMIAGGGSGPVDGVELRVLTTNVLAGAADVARLMELIRDNDVAVVAFQEFTPDIQVRLRQVGLDAWLPFSSVAAEAGTGGSAVYSRFPVTAAGSRRNPGGFLQAYAMIQPTGATPLLIESAHPLAPYAVGVLDSWREDLAGQPKADRDGAPRLLLGDFNSTLDHRALRDLIEDGGYHDAAASTGDGLVPTWGPYDGSPIPPVTIDHVLADERIGAREVRVFGVPRSDHRAVYASLTVPAA